MVEEIVSVKNIEKFKDKLWCQLYTNNKLKDFIQDYYIDKNNTWKDTMDILQITHRRLSKCLLFYGIKKPRNKINDRVQQSMMNRYGTKSYFENKEFKDKRKDTMIKRYGAEYTLQSRELMDKVYQTNLNKYGYENPFFDYEWQKQSGGSKESWSTKSREIRINNSMKRYNTKFPTQRHYKSNSAEIINDKDKFIDFINSLDENERTILNISNKLNLSYDVVNAHYKNYGLEDIIPLRQFRSLPEIEITNYIKTIYDKVIITNTRQIITPYELDIYLPDIRLAIEFDGNYWHDKNNQIKENRKDKMCLDRQIYLIHIWEDDWLNNREHELARIKDYIRGEGWLNEF